MADRTNRSIIINATAAKIMDVIADFPAYPTWVAAAKTVQVLTPGPGDRAQVVRFELDAGVLKETYDLAYDWAPDGKSVTWQLIRGDLQKSQYGAYTLEDQPDGSTRVSYELTVDLNVPMIGMFKRKAEKVITDTALKELKKRVEG
ncbi:SRPBCC family protein [Skermania sp. ID1734]|uniref:SRPBCC family protein n=1 Tax=Skermania sp. ID1734 TaxID=2597516 RepID=UPI00117FDE59|nr:SRPBCC family protein [Skermania sp. ID1734]TSE01197.1 SRPBCC family protein [Skermania sp. ID1734]